jgi:hypothetical protein
MEDQKSGVNRLATSLAVGLLLLTASAPLTAWGAQTVVVQDFEKNHPAPTVWVVNIPNDHAAVQLSSDQPYSGKQCLKLRYHFSGAGNFQYLGVPVKTRIQGPIPKLHFWLRGDDSQCSYGVQLTDVGGETHQYSKNTGQGGIIDFSGWRKITIDVDSPHETWGGDKNAKIDYPITAVTFGIGQPTKDQKLLPAEGILCFDLLSVDSEKGLLETLGSQVFVVAPDYGAAIQGDTLIRVEAPGFNQLTAKCWKQGHGPGADSTVATVTLDPQGQGSFSFPADQYPHGPMTIRITGEGGGIRDNCYLQLYNQGGASWNEGLPEAPAQAAGMELLFADDFDGPLSISSTDPKARYYDHKPPDGSQDFSKHPFTSFDKPNNPFHQVGTYLQIRASDDARSAGLISSLKKDGSGITARVPCYFECRFIGPNAIGTWPAFWLMTTGEPAIKECDEIDIIEAYGGEGPGHPNAYDSYMITPHCWNQGEIGKTIENRAFRALKNPCRMRQFGIPSAWYEAFHTYGCKITKTETIYYCDNIEVGRHETLPMCQRQPLFFMINLATGGGWPVDLSRYHGIADMYIDYVRVYQGNSKTN